MRLFEAIVEANREGGAPRLIVGDFAESLPIIALTCIDPRLNKLFPDVLGVPEEKFIWLRNAGNIITGPASSTMRSLALACAVKGGREVAIIGHSDCGVRKVTAMELTSGFARLGVERAKLPDDLVGFFGLFASERQNVITAVSHVRSSPLIGSGVPVHGLLVDIQSGRLEWVVNGYGDTARSPTAAVVGEPIVLEKSDPESAPPSPPPERPAAVEQWLSEARLVEAKEAQPPPLVRPARPAPGRRPDGSRR